MPDNRDVWCVRDEAQDLLGRNLYLTESVVALDEPCLPDLSQLLQTREMQNREMFTAWNRLDLNGPQEAATRNMYKAVYEEIKKMYQPKAPPMGKVPLGTEVGHLYRFAYEAKRGDLVVYPASEEEEKVYIGEIISDYFYVDCCYRHRRRVDWYEFPKVPVGIVPAKGFVRVNAMDVKKYKDKWSSRRTKAFP